MKVFCKRTAFNDKEEEKKCGYVRWKKNCWYTFKEPKNYESIYGYILTDETWWSVSKSTFQKYFYTQDELRDVRIQYILKN